MGRQSAPFTPVPVLLTRPAAEGHAFAAELTARFGPRVRPVVAPLMAMEQLAPPLPDGHFGAVIFTSAAGVDAARRLGWPLPANAWCVGPKTAQCATAAGFHARLANGDADALVAAIRADPPGGRLLHLRGEDAAGDVAARLTAAGLPTETRVVYRQRALPLEATAVALLSGPGPVILPLFSARSAALFRARVPPGAQATLWLVAISAAVANAAQAIPHRILLVAPQSSGPAMLLACGQALDDAAPP